MNPTKRGGPFLSEKCDTRVVFDSVLIDVSSEPERNQIARREPLLMHPTKQKSRVGASSSMPVRTTPMTLGPWVTAADRNNGSMEGR